jgi:hypothetical protein
MWLFIVTDVLHDANAPRPLPTTPTHPPNPKVDLYWWRWINQKTNNVHCHHTISGGVDKRISDRYMLLAS